MRKNSFNAKDCIAAVNKFKEAVDGKSFTKEQLLAMFKENRIPANIKFWQVFRKSGIIKQVSENQFVFADDKPVFCGNLERVYNQYHNMVHKSRKSRAKVEESVPENVEDEPQPEEDIEAMKTFAIDFLKELGYKILEPIATVYKAV